MLLQNAFCVFWFLWISAASSSILKASSSNVSSVFLGSNSYEMCSSHSFVTYDLNGTLTTLRYNSYLYGYAVCIFYIYFPAGINIQINVDDFYIVGGSTYSYLRIYTSNTTAFSTPSVFLSGTYGPVNFTYNLQNNAYFAFYLRNESDYGRFRLTWKAMPEYPISSSIKKSDCQGPDVLFLLDRSMAIFPEFYNNTIKDFMRKMASQYSFLDDITKQNPFSSKFGIIEFSDNAAVSTPLDKYTRVQFFWRLQNNTGYGSGGVSNVTAILNQLFTTLGNSSSSKIGVTIIMGELSVIKDPNPAYTAAQKVAKLNSDIYVLDETRFGPSSDIWTTLTNNQPNHIVNATSAADIEDFFETLLQDLQKSQC